MKTSLIIPVYNVRNCLDECLKSVLRQSVDDLEVILVDDGSTDGSGAACDAWAADKPFVTVIHQINGGLSAARNTGLDHASGDIIAFLDSDDRLGDGTLRDNLRYFADCPTLDLVEFPVREHEGSPDEHLLAFEPHWVPAHAVSPSTKKTDETSSPVFTDWVRQQGYAHCYVWNKLYRATLWQGRRFPVRQVFEDTAVMPDIMLACRTAFYSARGCYHYMRRAGSISRTWRYVDCRQLFLNQQALYKKASAMPGMKSALRPLRHSMLCRLIDMGRCKDCNKSDYYHQLEGMSSWERLQCRLKVLTLPPFTA